MDKKLTPLFCNDDDVISLGNNTYKIAKLNKAIVESCNNTLGRTLISETNQRRVKLDDRLNANDHGKLFNEGIDCEILKTDAKGWQKGKFKVRVSIEFLVEDTEETQIESPLDDIRKTITQNSL